MWHIVCKPVGNNPGVPNLPEDADEEQRKRWRLPWQRPAADADAVDDTNMGALVITLDDGSDHPRQEVCRVGYARRHTRNPDVAFGAQLAVSLDVAREAREVLNKLFADEGATV